MYYFDNSGLYVPYSANFNLAVRSGRPNEKQF